MSSDITEVTGLDHLSEPKRTQNVLYTHVWHKTIHDFYNSLASEQKLILRKLQNLKRNSKF